jgi:hypothetical protein
MPAGVPRLCPACQPCILASLVHHDTEITALSLRVSATRSREFAVLVITERIACLRRKHMTGTKGRLSSSEFYLHTSSSRGSAPRRTKGVGGRWQPIQAQSRRRGITQPITAQGRERGRSQTHGAQRNKAPSGRTNTTCTLVITSRASIWRLRSGELQNPPRPPPIAQHQHF